MTPSTRLAALFASLLVTFSIVSVIADYAKPADPATQLALRQVAASPATAGDASLVETTVTR